MPLPNKVRQSGHRTVAPGWAPIDTRRQLIAGELGCRAILVVERRSGAISRDQAHRWFVAADVALDFECAAAVQ
jgi:hypothetical protein